MSVSNNSRKQCPSPPSDHVVEISHGAAAYLFPFPHMYYLSSNPPSEIQDEYWNNVVLGTLGNTLEPDMITGLRLVERGLGEAAGACLPTYCHGQFFRICSTSKPHGLNSQTC